MNIMQLAQIISRAPNPNQAFFRMISQHPQGQQVINLMRGKSPEQFRGVLENMARERGTTLEQIISNMGFRTQR